MISKIIFYLKIKYNKIILIIINMLMTSKFIIILFYLNLFIVIKNVFVNGEQSYLRFRNSFLRIYIANEKTKQILINDYSNKIIQKTKKIISEKYNKLMNKCYNLNYYYNTLTDEEKELIEFIISLCY
jgi:hypothetical protein